MTVNLDGKTFSVHHFLFNLLGMSRRNISWYVGKER